MRTELEIKICGLTNLDDAQAAVDAGADYLGFVLYAKSVRGIRPAALRRILDGLDGAIKAVGVFVNERPPTVLQIAADCGLAAVQLHGDEAAADFDGAPVRIWRAVRLAGAVPRPAPADWPAERYVVDAAVPGKYGGTGMKADWNAAARLARRLPVMLAGGLTPDNVAEAIRTVRPVGVDVAGGVERSPGQKDRHKLEAFVRAARSVFSRKSCVKKTN